MQRPALVLDPLTGQPLSVSPNLTSLTANTQANGPVLGEFGNVDGQSNVKLTVDDANGTEVTFELKGAGYGQVIGGPEFQQVLITGTDENSKVEIKTQGKDTETAITDIVVDGSLKELKAKSTDLLGNLTITGTVEKLELDDVNSTSQQTIAIGGAQESLSLKVDQLSDVSLISQAPIKSIEATEWLDLNSTPDVLAAPTVDKLKIDGDKKRNLAGDFQAGLYLSGSGTGEPTLEKVEIDGHVSDGIWQVQGDVDQLTVGSTATDWSVNIDGTLEKLKVEDNFQGTLAAQDIEKVDIKGDLTQAHILSGTHLGADGQLGGSDTAADIYGSGTIEEVKVKGDVIDAVVGAGLDPLDGVFNNGNDQLVGGLESEIEKLEIKETASSDSLFAAGAFGKTKIDGATIDPETDERFLTPSKVTQDTTAPVIAAALLNDTATNSDGISADATITGTVTDASGIVSLRAGLDNTLPVDFTEITAVLQPGGQFTLDLSQLTLINGDELLDGSHTLYLQAVDAVGNSSELFELAFTLDRAQPQIELTDPLDQAPLSLDSRLTGHIDGTGSGVTTLSYHFNDLPAVAVPLSSEGEFDHGLDLAEIAKGPATLTLTAVDLAGNTVTQTFNVTIANQAPTDLSLTPSTLDENVLEGSSVGQLSTTDPDPGDSHTYTLVAGAGDQDNAAFTITGDQLSINTSPDFETQGSYTIRVRSQDPDGGSLEKVLTISINDVNEAPTQIQLSQVEVAEDALDNTVIGELSTLDPDAGDSHTYTLIDDAGGRFQIAGDQLQVAPGALLDFETTPSHTLEVRSTDGGGLSTTQQFTITITDVNEAPTDVTLTPNTILENDPDDSVVGTLTTTDPDLGDTHTYSLVSGDGDTDNSAFTIAGDQLHINTSPDFETQSSYSLRVRSQDADGLSTEKMLTVIVTNTNEAPTQISLSQDTLPENTASGVTIGQLSALDPDVGDGISYQLVDDAGGRFQIVGDQLQVAPGAVLDFEAQSTHTIVVEGTDSGGLSLIQSFEIQLSDVNEAPTALGLSADHLAENVPDNTVIGSLSTADPDLADDHTYTLVTGAGDIDNGAFTLVDNQLQINASPDFEVQSSYSIRVRSTDSAGLSTEQIFTIRIDDVNEAPTQIGLTQVEVVENAAEGTLIGQLSTLDPDLGDGHSYTLTDDAGGRFQIVGDQLQVAADADLDFETDPSHTITVRSTDNGQPSLFHEQSFTITVTDVNEIPVLSAGLLQDTGTTDTDGITTDATITGTISADHSLVSLRAGFNDIPVAEYVEIWGCPATRWQLYLGWGPTGRHLWRTPRRWDLYLTSDCDGYGGQCLGDFCP